MSEAVILHLFHNDVFLVDVVNSVASFGLKFAVDLGHLVDAHRPMQVVDALVALTVGARNHHLGCLRDNRSMLPFAALRSR